MIGMVWSAVRSTCEVICGIALLERGGAEASGRVLEAHQSPAIGMAWLSQAWLDRTGRSGEMRLNKWSANSIG
jgi:hypothetical protein